MSGNNNDQPNPDLPPVNIPPTPELPPLPWEEDAAKAAAASEQPAPAPEQPAPAQPDAQANPFPGAAPAAAQPADPYAANAQQQPPAPGADPYAAQQQAGQQQGYLQAPGQPGAPMVPAYAQQGGAGQPPAGYPQNGYLGQTPPKRKPKVLLWVIIALVVVLVIAVGLVGNALHWFDGRGAEEGAGDDVDVPLSEPAPDGLGYAWNTDGVSSGDWTFSYQAEDGFEASTEESVCAFVGYTYSLADLGLPDSGASDDAAASTADFQAYIDSLGTSADIESQDVEDAGTVAVETSAGTVEFQAYNVNLNWADENQAVTKERWYWRTFVESDTAMLTYVSCGEDNISAEIDSLHELTID